MKAPRKLLVVVFLGILSAVCCSTVFFGIWSVWKRTNDNDKEWVAEQTSFTKFTFAGSAECIAFSSDSKYLVVGTKAYRKGEAREWYGALHIWDVAKNKELHCERFDMFVPSISLHPHGKKILVASSNELDGRPGVRKGGQVMIYEFPTIRLLDSFEVGNGIARRAAKYSPDGKLIGILKKDGTGHWDPMDIVIYADENLKKMACVSNLNATDTFDFTPDSRFVIAGHYTKINPATNFYGGGVLDVYEAATGKLRKRFQDGQYPHEFAEEKIRIIEPPNPNPEAKSPDGRFKVIAKSKLLRGRPYETQIALASPTGNSEKKLFHDHSNREVGPACSAFAPNGKLFAVGRSAYREVKPNEPPGDAMGDVLLFTVPE